MVEIMRKIHIFSLILFFALVLQACDYDMTFVFELNPGIDTIEIHTEHIDALATSKVGRSLLDVVVILNEVDTSKLGIYAIIYETTYLDKTYQIIRYVTVIDETAPVIILNPGIDTVFLNETWIDASVTVFDNSLGEVYLTVEGEVDPSREGQYEIVYTATDESGNQASMIRYVNVVLRENVNESS
jgi:hypothetical protein